MSQKLFSLIFGLYLLLKPFCATASGIDFKIFYPLRTADGPRVNLLHRGEHHSIVQMIRIKDKRVTLQSRGTIHLHEFFLAEERLIEQKGFVDFVVVKFQHVYLLYAIKEDFSLWGMDLANSWIPSNRWLGRLANLSARAYQLTRIKDIPSYLIFHNWKDETGAEFKFADLPRFHGLACERTFSPW